MSVYKKERLENAVLYLSYKYTEKYKRIPAVKNIETIMIYLDLKELLESGVEMFGLKIVKGSGRVRLSEDAYKYAKCMYTNRCHNVLYYAPFKKANLDYFSDYEIEEMIKAVSNMARLVKLVNEFPAVKRTKIGGVVDKAKMFEWGQEERTLQEERFLLYKWERNKTNKEATG